MYVIRQEASTCKLLKRLSRTCSSPTKSLLGKTIHAAPCSISIILLKLQMVRIIASNLIAYANRCHNILYMQHL